MITPTHPQIAGPLNKHSPRLPKSNHHGFRSSERVPAVPAVSGSWMVAPELLREGKWAEVTAQSATAVRRAAR